MRSIIQITFLCIFSLINYSQLAQASINPESFLGHFRVGKCSINSAQFATITLITNEQSTKNIIITFDEEKLVTLKFYIDSNIFGIKTTLESFVITNDYFTKDINGLILPLSQMKIGRSATGDRVRLNTADYQSNEETQCVLYRIK
ncbi:MAG: hypothetical protein Q7U04_04635 [Bacteriovorax sp.]|nr:hypothetical protein [Bacteriovorax sp.]